MAQQLALESFEQCHGDSSAASAEYSAGYQEGLAEATAAFQADQNTLSSAFVQTVSDLNFSYAEARAQLIEQLEPLFTVVTQKLLPQISHENFGAILIEAITGAAARDTAQPPVLHVHPSQRQLIEKLSKEQALDVEIREDPTLSAHAAWIGLAHGETHLDIDSLLTNISETLDAIVTYKSKDGRHE